MGSAAPDEMAHGGDRGGKPRAVVIAGPTASGKSALAVEIARALGGTVVNADSMQVYADLSILTARPTAEDMERVPHRLYGHVPARERYTVARWLGDMATVLAELRDEGRTPVIVGGAGLYLTALTQGFSAVPPVPPAVEAAWRERAGSLTAPDLHGLLADVDPVMAERLRPSDPQRILRALIVRDATGRSLADWQAERDPPVLAPDRVARLVLAPDRSLLHRRIADRFRAMAANGGLDEARALAALDLDPALPAMKAIGVPEMMAAALGKRPVDEAVEAAIVATRRYARRQETWFRNQFAHWRTVPVGEDGVAMRAAELMEDRGTRTDGADPAG
nr:tRNA (adenosine(37)-N6)-dimethylallyltransferase MiaA [Chthonobacter rhizosphaerae]